MRRNYGVACTGSAAAGLAVVHKSSVCIAPGTLPFVSLCMYVCVCIVYTRTRVQTYLYTYIHRERLRRRRGKLLSLSLISADSMNMERLLKWLNSRNSLSHTHTHVHTLPLLRFNVYIQANALVLCTWKSAEDGGEGWLVSYSADHFIYFPTRAKFITRQRGATAAATPLGKEKRERMRDKKRRSIVTKAERSMPSCCCSRRVGRAGSGLNWPWLIVKLNHDVYAYIHTHTYVHTHMYMCVAGADTQLMCCARI